MEYLTRRVVSKCPLHIYVRKTARAPASLGCVLPVITEMTGKTFNLSVKTHTLEIRLEPIIILYSSLTTTGILQLYYYEYY